MAKRENAADRQRYVLYARGHRPPDEHRRTHVVIFEDPSQAKTWLMKFLGNHPHHRDAKFILLEDLGIQLQIDKLDEILAAEDTSWQLPDQYAQWILRFKYGSWDEDHSKIEDEVETVKEDGTVVKEKKPKEAKPKRPTKPDGWITIGEWCEKWKIKPLHARTCLRASDLEKPEFGWAFDPKDEKKIKKICGVN